MEGMSGRVEDGGTGGQLGYLVGVKGIIHPKMKILSSFTLMLFQICMTFFCRTYLFSMSKWK